jgi:hypothetical protein
MKWAGSGVAALAACSSTYPSVIHTVPAGGEPYHAAWPAQPGDTLGASLAAALHLLEGDDWIATVANVVLELAKDHQHCLFRIHAIHALENGTAPTRSADHEVQWCQPTPRRKTRLKYICRPGSSGPYCSHQPIEYMQSVLECIEPTAEMRAMGTIEVVIRPLGCRDSSGTRHVLRAIAYEQDFR